MTDLLSCPNHVVVDHHLSGQRQRGPLMYTIEVAVSLERRVCDENSFGELVIVLDPRPLEIRR